MKSVHFSPSVSLRWYFYVGEQQEQYPDIDTRLWLTSSQVASMKDHARKLVEHDIQDADARDLDLVHHTRSVKDRKAHSPWCDAGVMLDF